MTRTARPRHLTALALAAALPLLLAACSDSQYPNSTFTSLTDINRDSTSLWNLMIWLGIAVFVFVELLLIYVMFRYRRRPGGPEPEHIHGNTKLELTWTILPAFVLAIIAVPTVQQIWKYQSGAPANALQIDVIGHQWWWEFRYPEQNITTANELYIPTGRPVNFTLQSRDVIHSFWVPSLAGKMDMIPGRLTRLALEPTRTGTFRGACAEYCGASHALMAFDVVVTAGDEFERWLDAQNAPATAPADPLAIRGRETFLANGCSACHTIRGTPAAGRIGPDLTHVASRASIGAATLPNETNALIRWIRETDRLKPGVHMPAFRAVSPADLAALAAYLRGLQ